MKECLATELLHYCNVSVEKCVRISPHTIDYYDLTFVLDGEMTYIANGKQIVLQKNDAIFLPPNTLRERLIGKERVHYVSFNFQTTSKFEFSFPKYYSKSVTREIRTAALNFPTSHLTPNTHSYEKCLHLLNYILYSFLDQQRIETQNHHVLFMLHYIDMHISEPITLQHISEAVCLSREYASHLFHREMGETLTNYINRQKMELAKGMILGGEMSLEDISVTLGFENYNYFSRVFKTRFGVPPVQYKNKKQTKK